MNTTDLPFLLALQNLENFGPVLQRRCLEIFGSAQKIFTASENELMQFSLSSNQISQIKQLTHFDIYHALAERILAEGITCLFYKDDEYPRRLLEISGFPVVLFVKGDANVLVKYSHFLGVVGARAMTPYGKKSLEKILPDLCLAGVVIVSGMAFGIDECAHALALKNNTPTIAVQAYGVNQPYPRSHLQIYKEIIKNGCVISEFPLMDEQPQRYHFPRRNRLISGLSDGVLVAEAKQRSGSLITAQFALEQNRNVYAIPGSIFYQNSEGCLNLLKQGAKPVACAQDILEDFVMSATIQNTKSTSEKKSDKIVTDFFATPLEKQIYQLCFQEPVSLDVIVEATQGGVSEISATITKMQILGKIEETKDRKFTVL